MTESKKRRWRIAAISLCASLPFAVPNAQTPAPMSRAQAQEYLDEHQIYPVAGNLPGAIMNGRVDDVRAMLAVGVDPNGTEAEGLGSVMRFVAMTCQTGIPTADTVALVQVLAGAGAVMKPSTTEVLPPIVSAAQRCPGEVMRAFVNAGADHSERTTQGYTPLSMALMLGNLDAAKALIDAGAKLSKSAAAKLLESAEDNEVKALIKRAST